MFVEYNHLYFNLRLSSKFVLLTIYIIMSMLTRLIKTLNNVISCTSLNNLDASSLNYDH